MHFALHTSQQFPTKRLNSCQCAMLWKYRHLFLGNFDVAKNRQDLAESIAKGKTVKKQKPWKQCSACNVTCEKEGKSTEWDFDAILPRFLMTCLHDKFHFLSVPTNASVVSILTTSTSTVLPAHSGWSCFRVSPRGISCHYEFFGFHHFSFSSHSFLMFPFPGSFLLEVLFHLMWKISQFYVIGSSIKFHFLETCWSSSLRGNNK